MDNEQYQLPPLKVPAPPKPISVKYLVGIFVVAFVIILTILNAPTLFKTISYPLTHSEESDNEQLTQQYRDIYGYEKNPEIITSVIASTLTPTPRPSQSPVIINPSQLNTVISIPKINVSAPVIQVGDSNDTTILNALKKGVVLYPGSSNPGQPGTSVIVGHSSSDLPWTEYSSVFSLLDKLQTNDLIYVTVGGTQYTYRVRAIQKGSAQQLIDSGFSGDLVVATCWPVGTDANRIAVSASLVQ